MLKYDLLRQRREPKPRGCVFVCVCAASLSILVFIILLLKCFLHFCFLLSEHFACQLMRVAGWTPETSNTSSVFKRKQTSSSRVDKKGETLKLISVETQQQRHKHESCSLFLVIISLWLLFYKSSCGQTVLLGSIWARITESSHITSPQHGSRSVIDNVPVNSLQISWSFLGLSDTSTSEDSQTVIHLLHILWYFIN